MLQPRRLPLRNGGPLGRLGKAGSCRRRAPSAAAASRPSSHGPQSINISQPPASLLFIAWDLDNMPVQHLAHLPLVARRLAAACCQHIHGQPRSRPPPLPLPCRLTAYANERTLARLEGPGAAERALALVGGRLVAVKTRR